MPLDQEGGKSVGKTEDNNERNRNSPRCYRGQSPCAIDHRLLDRDGSGKPVRGPQIAQRFNSTHRVILSKLSIAKLAWIGLIPLQAMCNFLLRLGAVGQASSKCQFSAEADCLDSRPQLLSVFDPVSFQPCVR